MRGRRRARLADLLAMAAASVLLIASVALFVEQSDGAAAPAVLMLTTRVASAPRFDRVCAGETPVAQRRQRIVDLAASQWRRFGYVTAQQAPDGALRPAPWLRSTVLSAVAAAHGARVASFDKRGFSERDREVGVALVQYWAGAGFDRPASARAVRRGEPWSAAFVSWVMCAAGATDRNFARASNHARYVRAALAGESPDFWYVGDQPLQATAPGDLLCARRDGGALTRAALLAPAPMAAMHCDIVVARPRADIAWVIGGNVLDAAALSEVALVDSARPLMRLALRAPTGGEGLARAFLLRSETTPTHLSL